MADVMRPVVRRVRAAVGWRVRRVKTRYEDRVRPRSPRRDAYARLLDGAYAEGANPTFVFAVDKVSVDTIASADVLGLALALAEKGHGVQVITAGSAVPPADVVVGASARFDPFGGPDQALRIAWVRTDIDRWETLPFLSAYDIVLAGSPLAVRRMARSHSGTQLLRPAVDAELFGGTPSAKRRRRALSADTQKGIARFRLPSLYGRRLAVIDRTSAEVRRQGVVSQRVLEIAATGAVPVTTALVGPRELGFESVPGIDDALPARSTLTSLGAELRAAVLEEHTFALRAEQLVNVIVPGAERTGLRKAVHVAPFYRRNPYQAMLYATMADIGVAMVPVADVNAHLLLRARLPDPGLFHLHWTNPIVQPAGTEAEGRERLDAFVAALEAFRRAGGKLIWTIHNVLPHDARHHDLEIELANEILHRADVVHLLSKETLDRVGGVYDVDPERVVIVEHNSFVGIYPQWITRDGARARLELEPDEKVLIVVGGIRPYKGIDRMLDILDELLEDDRTVRLLVAGSAGKQPGIAELEERCLAHPRVVSKFEHLPDPELQAWYAAADVAVLPYVNILNSSAFQLAPSFGLPVVGPRMGALESFEDEPYVRLFDPTSDRDLFTVVKAALTDFAGDEAMRETAKRSAESRPPVDMATAFARVIDDVLRS